MIPRAVIAKVLGLPADTDALPPGDLPLDRFAARYVAYLGTSDAGTETPDAWTGAVMDHLIAEEPDLALATIRAGLGVDPEGVLADPLAELGATNAMDEQIASLAAKDPAFAALVERANTQG